MIKRGQWDRCQTFFWKWGHDSDDPISMLSIAFWGSAVMTICKVIDWMHYHSHGRRLSSFGKQFSSIVSSDTHNLMDFRHWDLRCTITSSEEPIHHKNHNTSSVTIRSKSNQINHYVLCESASNSHPTSWSMVEWSHTFPTLLLLQPRQNDLPSIHLCLGHVHPRRQFVSNHVLPTGYFASQFVRLVCG